MSGSLDWGDDRAPPPQPNRRWVEVVCCPDCQAVDVRRESSVGGVAYWSCTCGCRWKEATDTGRGHARIA